MVIEEVVELFPCLDDVVGMTRLNRYSIYAICVLVLEYNNVLFPGC